MMPYFASYEMKQLRANTVTPHNNEGSGKPARSLGGGLWELMCLRMHVMDTQTSTLPFLPCLDMQT